MRRARARARAAPHAPQVPRAAQRARQARRGEGARELRTRACARVRPLVARGARGGSRAGPTVDADRRERRARARAVQAPSDAVADGGGGGERGTGGLGGGCPGARGLLGCSARGLGEAGGLVAKDCALEGGRRGTRVACRRTVRAAGRVGEGGFESGSARRARQRAPAPTGE